MKSLTLYQPWASLVATGVKQVETRGWTTKYRGPLAIHSAKKFHIGAWPIGLMMPTIDLCDGNLGNYPKCLPLGEVIAMVNLVDVVPASEIHWTPDPPEQLGGVTWYQQTTDLDITSTLILESERPLGDYDGPGRYAWLLEAVVPFDPPVPARGHQGLWEWDERTF